MNTSTSAKVPQIYSEFIMPNIAIIVDLETTGLDANYDQIIEIGAIKIDLESGEIIDKFQTFSLPESNYVFEEEGDVDEDGFIVSPFKLDPFIINLTGITDEMLIGAPSNANAVESFFKFADSYPIWAYNAQFDSKFLNQHIDEHRSLRDILVVARKTFPELKNHKLSTVANHLNISIEGAHRALADCLISKEILIKGLQLQKLHPELVQYHNFKASDFIANEQGIFYGKTIVFTGSLTAMSRETAADHASKYGFKIGSGVTKKTDYLVVGVQDLDKLAGHEKSLKHRKAEELIKNNFSIKIITESNFISMITSDNGESRG